ncbi:acyl-CoA dehydrogenase family protein [Streptomyces sp. NPDC093064]|uniref:acyl-CoA dehydrogenase family protein n=1 Tax=unclassified Streptomyces TaxID=2593676 RepID=UPI0034371DAE
MTTAIAGPDLNFDVLPAEVRRFQQQVREYARDELAPRALELDLADAADFDWDIVQKGHELGLTRALMPKEYGGLGVGVLGVAVAMEELAAACPAVALIFGATMLGQTPILLSGDPRLQARFLPLFAGDEAVLAANGIAEEEAGSDLVIPENFVHARMATTARRDGDFYVINGHKKFCTNGKVAAFASIFANMVGRPGATGLTCFIVPLDEPGVTRGEVADKMGYRACLGTTLHFDDVRVPVEYMIGGEGTGAEIDVAQGNMARSSVAAISTGIARSALEHAVDWCGKRVQGGKLLHEHQFSAGKLAEMSANVDAARLLYQRAANKVDNELPAPEYEPAVAKLFADRIAIETAGAAVSLMGARGYCREYGAEKILRDSYGTRIFEGTQEALALTVTASLYREEDEL